VGTLSLLLTRCDSLLLLRCSPLNSLFCPHCSANGKFISNRNSLLRLCTGASDKTAGCGATSSANFNRFATFSKTQGTFVGTCGGPKNTKSCKCVSGWMGKHCNVQCLGQGSVTGICNGHGKCALATATDGKEHAQCNCAANSGWIGVGCDEKCPFHNNQACGGVKIGKCFKDPVKGPACKCVNDRKGDQCQLQCPGSQGGVGCSGHGACKMQSAKTAVCECKKNFRGAACDRGLPHRRRQVLLWLR
jgi:hypothetical protein